MTVEDAAATATLTDTIGVVEPAGVERVGNIRVSEFVARYEERTGARAAVCDAQLATGGAGG